MRAAALLFVILCPWPVMAWADDTLPVIGTPAPSASSEKSQVCVQVLIAGEAVPDYTCLNQALGDQARIAQRLTNVPPIDATAAAVKVGGFNQAALSQQYGKNWGNSPVPYRPPAPAYANPLTGR
jgi:hypothetical protein